MFFSTPQRAALISVGSNMLLVAAKIAVAVVSGSAALLSEALHSGLDLLASFLAWLSLLFTANGRTSAPFWKASSSWQWPCGCFMRQGNASSLR
jgi:Co/Zn/Cd efflux system component